jgi:hypothetical protein
MRKILFILFISTVSLSAQKQQKQKIEIILSQADSLIAKKEIQKGLLLLNQHLEQSENIIAIMSLLLF